MLLWNRLRTDSGGKEPLGRAGQRATGMIAVAAGVDAAWTSGHRNQWRETGPKLRFVAGAHGTEYASIYSHLENWHKRQIPRVVGNI